MGHATGPMPLGITMDIPSALEELTSIDHRATALLRREHEAILGAFRARSARPQCAALRFDRVGKGAARRSGRGSRKPKLSVAADRCVPRRFELRTALQRPLFVREALVAEEDGNFARSVVGREHGRLTPRFSADTRESLADIGFHARYIFERRVQER